jgi:adenine-specific DNA-methyltransferase
MNNKHQRLELTWIGKDVRPKLEPRILLEDPTQSYHAKHRVGENDLFDNRLIFGDNLLALKALEQEFAGKMRCIYIDPPYNTGQAMEHYDDGLEHSIWLSLMRERFELLKKLLRPDGVLLCQLNDEEMAYAKVLLDEIFGRSNFLNHVTVRMKQTAGASGGGEDKKLKKNTEHILIFAKNKDGLNGFIKFNDVYDEADLFEIIEEMRLEGKSWKYTRALIDLGKRRFLRQIEDGSGEPIKVYVHENVVMKPISVLAQEEGLTEENCYRKYFDRIFRDTNAQSSIRTRVIDATAGAGEFFSIEYVPRSGRRKSQEVTLYYKGTNCDLIAWLSDVAVKKGDRLVKLEKAGTYWEGFPLNNLTKEGDVFFPKGKKPEALIQKILELCTDEGDWVLDSFAGSGTTGAVAQKMRRRWVMIELGNHCDTHIVPRLRRVIDGQDTAGITKGTTWRGGGGFRYYRLAPSLLQRDRFDQWVVNKEYNAEMLAAAVAKLEGFTFAPSADLYWQQGFSTESDFIYVTTQTLNAEQLQALSDDVGPKRTLLVCCSAFRLSADAIASRFPNLTVKKIPKMVLQKCEWGHDDYSLNVENLPAASAPVGDGDAPAMKTRPARQSTPQTGLFDEPGS